MNGTLKVRGSEWLHAFQRKFSVLHANAHDSLYGGLEKLAGVFEPFTWERKTQKYLEKKTDEVLARVQEYASLSDEQLLAQSQDLRERIHASIEPKSDKENVQSDATEGETAVPNHFEADRELSPKDLRQAFEPFVTEAYALAYQAIIRAKLPSNKGGTIDELTRQQVKGGVALLDHFIDMKTGEGKTITALLPAYLDALAGRGVHIDTVNEYLAFRDYQQAQQVLSRLGVRVGVTLSNEGFKEYHKEEVAAFKEEAMGEVRAHLEEIVSGVRKSFDRQNVPQHVFQKVAEQFMGRVATEVENFIEQNYVDAPFDVKQNLYQKLVAQRLGKIAEDNLNRMFNEEVNGRLNQEVEQRVNRAIHFQNRGEKVKAYAADITYGYHAEFAFDYLRDNTQKSPEDKVNPMRRYTFAIVDEVDNILIDEGRTPHILSEPVDKIYSDKFMHAVKDAVLSLMAEQKGHVTEAEKKISELDNAADLEKQGAILEYATNESIPPQQVQERLLQEGEALELKVKLGEIDDEFGRDIGKELFLLRYMTGSSALFDRMFEKYKPHFFAYANREPEERQKLLDTLDYVIDHGSICLTERGIDKFYASGLMKEETFIVNEAALLPSGKSESPRVDAPSLDDYLNHIHNFTAVMPLSNEAEIVDAITRQFQRDEPIHVELKLDSPQNHTVWQLVTTFMRAHELFREGQDYIVSDGKVVVVDHSTHRPKPSSRYSRGIHEALECLHGVEIKKPNVTIGSISLQKYFMRYGRMTGMSGSVLPIADELDATYDVRTVAIEPSRSLQRVDHGLRFYAAEAAKHAALTRELLELHAKGQPILLGVSNVTEAEKYAAMLEQHGVRKENIQTLTARDAMEDSFEEAALIAQAGQTGKITIATNMAGRGTDIKLSPEAAAKGGLSVILSYVPESQRAVQQFIGRAGRLGDPGASAVYGSTEDELFSYFQGSLGQRMSIFFGAREVEEDLCQSPLMRRLFNRNVFRILQTKGESARAAREHTLKYDLASSALREKYYTLRDALMESPESVYPMLCSGNGQVQQTDGEKWTQALREPDLPQRSLRFLDAEWVKVQADLDEIRENIHLRSYAGRPDVEFARICDGMYRTLVGEYKEFLKQNMPGQEMAGHADSYHTKTKATGANYTEGRN